ncbi:unnamed protein product [Ectocarpus sp. 12 AP-2014]
MFLVYAPVVFVSLYFCAKGVGKCLPRRARGAISRCVSEVVVATAITCARIVNYAGAVRSSYIWDKRGAMSSPFWGVARRVLDAFFRVDAKQLHLDTSYGHDSIGIIAAISTVNGQDYDVTTVLDEMWADGDGLRINVPVDVALKRVGCLHDSVAEINVTTRIRYRGHSNIRKRYGAQTFSARYACNESSSQTTVFRFPPYSSSQSIQRGLGTAPRVVRCNFVEENGTMLYGTEARESAGLHRNFYEDVDDDPCLVKKVVTFFHPSARFQERKEVVVSTSKSNVKIHCNLKVPT